MDCANLHTYLVFIVAGAALFFVVRGAVRAINLVTYIFLSLATTATAATAAGAVTCILFHCAGSTSLLFATNDFFFAHFFLKK